MKPGHSLMEAENGDKNSSPRFLYVVNGQLSFKTTHNLQRTAIH